MISMIDNGTGPGKQASNSIREEPGGNDLCTLLLILLIATNHVETAGPSSMLMFSQFVLLLEIASYVWLICSFVRTNFTAVSCQVWRQLWRVLERSDMAVQIVDARNPLLY